MHFSQIEAIHKLNRPSVIKIKIIRGIIREEFFLFETKLNISLMMQLFFFPKQAKSFNATRRVHVIKCCGKQKCRISNRKDDVLLSARERSKNISNGLPNGKFMSNSKKFTYNSLKFQYSRWKQGDKSNQQK